MMDKIKSHFVFLLCYDKIEPEVEAQKGGVGGEGKNAENSYFRLVSIYLYFTGVHCVCAAKSWGKIGISNYSNSAEWIWNSSGGNAAILQLSDCIMWEFKKPDVELVPCQTPSLRRQRDLFPPVCVSHH